jgi:hypothetical protein
VTTSEGVVDAVITSEYPAAAWRNDKSGRDSPVITEPNALQHTAPSIPTGHALL